MKIDLSAGPITRFDGLAADAPPRSLRGRIPVLFNPFLRFGIFWVLLLLVVILCNWAMLLIVGGNLTSPPVVATMQLLSCVLTYLVLTLLLERRRPPLELAPRRLGGLAWGLLAGALAFTVVFALIWLLGGFVVQGPGHPSPAIWWWSLFILGVTPGVTEEILFRGVIYRFLEETLGSWVAIALSAALFGVAHSSNPEATLWSGLAIALEAGLLLGVLYAWTRSLWLVMGFHIAWNIFQGPVFGTSVSGIGPANNSLLAVNAEGSPLLSGGQFGPETSIIAVSLLTAVAVLIAVRLVRTGAVVAPMWSRRGRQRRAIAEESRPNPRTDSQPGTRSRRKRRG